MRTWGEHKEKWLYWPQEEWSPEPITAKFQDRYTATRGDFPDAGNVLIQHGLDLKELAAGGASPDFDNPISTLVVPSKDRKGYFI